MKKSLLILFVLLEIANASKMSKEEMFKRPMYDDWRKAGVYTWKEAKKWKDLYIQPGSVVQEWKDAGVKTPEEAKQWKHLNIDYKGIKILKELNLNTIEKYNQWAQFGYGALKPIKNPHEIKKWIQRGITDPRDASRWNLITSNQSGYYALDGYDEWIIKAKVKDYREALKWNVDMHFSYEDVMYFNKHNITMNDIKNECKGFITSSEFVNSNPNKHIGECVSTCVKSIQLIDNNTLFGFDKINENRAIYVTAKGNLNNDFRVNAPICGAYKIISTEEIKFSNGTKTIGNVFKRLSSR